MSSADLISSPSSSPSVSSSSLVLPSSYAASDSTDSSNPFPSVTSILNRRILLFRTLLVFLLFLSLLFTFSATVSHSWFSGHYSAPNRSIRGATDIVDYQLGPYHECLHGQLNLRALPGCVSVSISRLDDDESHCIAFNYQKLNSCATAFALRVCTRAFLVLQLMVGPIALFLVAFQLASTIPSGWRYIKRARGLHTSELIQLNKNAAWIGIILVGVGAVFNLIILACGAAGYNSSTSNMGGGFVLIILAFIFQSAAAVAGPFLNRPNQQAVTYPEDEDESNNRKDLEEGKLPDQF